jgi:hypothetical protein
MQISERDAVTRVDDVDGLATSLNQVARQLGLTAPLVTSTGTRGSRTFTVDDRVAQFVQDNARRTGRAPQAAAPQRDTHGF